MNLPSFISLFVNNLLTGLLAIGLFSSYQSGDPLWQIVPMGFVGFFLLHVLFVVGRPTVELAIELVSKRGSTQS